MQFPRDTYFSMGNQRWMPCYNFGRVTIPPFAIVMVYFWEMQKSKALDDILQFYAYKSTLVKNTKPPHMRQERTRLLRKAKEWDSGHPRMVAMVHFWDPLIIPNFLGDFLNGDGHIVGQTKHGISYFWINGGNEIEPGGFGLVTQDLPTFVRYQRYDYHKVLKEEYQGGVEIPEGVNPWDGPWHKHRETATGGWDFLMPTRGSFALCRLRGAEWMGATSLIFSAGNSFEPPDGPNPEERDGDLEFQGLPQSITFSLMGRAEWLNDDIDTVFRDPGTNETIGRYKDQYGFSDLHDDVPETPDEIGIIIHRSMLNGGSPPKHPDDDTKPLPQEQPQDGGDIDIEH